jgi:8-oxo-dGTP pyrophosphatase MutT (NUDIX family)
LEPNESIIQGAKREAEEETGIVAHDVNFLNVVEESEDENRWLHFTFITEKEDADPILKEPEKFERWEFFSVDNLPELLPSHKKIISAFLKKQSFSY